MFAIINLARDCELARGHALNKLLGETLISRIVGIETVNRFRSNIIRPTRLVCDHFRIAQLDGKFAGSRVLSITGLIGFARVWTSSGSQRQRQIFQARISLLRLLYCGTEIPRGRLAGMLLLPLPLNVGFVCCFQVFLISKTHPIGRTRRDRLRRRGGS